MAEKTLRGADVQVYINGQLMPEAQSITYNEQMMQDNIYGIDSPFPQETAITRYLVNGSISGLQLRTDRLSTTRIMAQYTNLLSAPYIKITIKDRYTGSIITDISRAVVSAKSITVQAKSIVRVNFSFTAGFAK